MIKQSMVKTACFVLRVDCGMGETVNNFLPLRGKIDKFLYCYHDKLFSDLPFGLPELFAV